MLGEVFYWLLNMSIIAAVTGLVVLAVRRVRKIPRRAVVVLWAIPFLRMVVPVGMNRPYSLMALLNRGLSRAVNVYETKHALSFSMMNSMRLAESYFPTVYKYGVIGGVLSAAAVIWLGGALLILTALAAQYVAALRAVPGKGIIYAEKARSPAVYGIIRPRVVLPADVDKEHLPLILMHERAHIRRGDNLWRLLALIIAAAHWFNPLAWVFLKCFLADMELACDECVLAGLDAARQKDYARALLACGEKNSPFVSAFGGAGLKTRIENILSYRRLTGLALAGTAALIAALFGALLTNAG